MSPYWGYFKTTECIKIVLGHRAWGLACQFTGWSLLGTEARPPYPQHGGVAGLHGQEEDTHLRQDPLSLMVRRMATEIPGHGENVDTLLRVALRV